MQDSTAEDWAFPVNQKYLSQSMRTRHTQLLAERERFSHALDVLPHSFAHLGAQYRNVLLRERATQRRAGYPVRLTHRIAGQQQVSE